MLGRLFHGLKMLRCLHFKARTFSASAYFYGDQFLRPVDSNIIERVPRPTSVAFLKTRSITAIATGWGHSVFVTATGSAVLSGRPLDFRNTMRHINLHTFIPAVQRIVDDASKLLFSGDLLPSEHVAPCGAAFVAAFSGPASLTALLTTTGKLYTIGQNFWGQAGIGSTNPSILYEPHLVEGFPPSDCVADVAVGFEHVLAVTSSGALYSWGRGDRGQCGHGDEESYTHAIRVVGPREVFLDLRVVAVAAGPSTSVCITDDGRVWTWGKMASLQPRSQRGDGWIMADQILPRPVAWALSETTGEYGGNDEMSSSTDSCRSGLDSSGRLAIDVPAQPSLSSDRRAVAVSCGQAHTCFLTADGRIWMLGMRGRGATYDDSDLIWATPTYSTSLGESTHPVSAFFPEPFGLPERIDEVPAVASISEPVADVHMQTEPIEVPPGPLAGKRVVRLRSSVHHTYAVTECGRVFRFGWRLRVLEMPELSDVFVEDVAFGFRHALVMGAKKEPT
jgi:hypothetical protein